MLETFKIIEDYYEAVEKIENDVNEMKKNSNSYDEKYEELAIEVKSLKNRRDLDEMVSVSIKLKLDTKICNFSCGNSTPRCAMPP